ncbi:HAMP domain-containing histidine kinase [Bacillus sp. RO2]|uniref:sensor histidine kinase n=1 Tax=Bacillus sp. RO2 TaxID=2723913 RepID=UPI00145F94F0|nr:HAMP domain-containing sensor histidine kinase [Bacillus sp. RO2]NMH72069.1 HAMP domain-containing histidine kinase [Bacillus sp. RO2]
MSVSKKLAFHFVKQLFVLLIIIIIALTSALFFFASHLTESEMKASFTRTDPYFLELELDVKSENDIQISEAVKTAVHQNDGWLQLINKKGVVVKEINAPADLKEAYTFQELANFEVPGYRTSHWRVFKDDSDLVVLYGEKNLSEGILAELQKLGDLSTITEEGKSFLESENAWIQVYDSNGEKIEQWNAPEDLTLSARDFLSIKERPWNYTYDVSTLVEGDKVYVVGMENAYYAPDDVLDGLMGASLVKNFLLVIMVLLIIIIALSIWYGRTIGVPLLYMMNWIKRMSKGDLSVPRNKKGNIPFRKKNGKLHKRFRIFRDILFSIRKLANTLEKNEQYQKRVDQTREEWITGLSHDLKTPLSSIYGYAKILETGSYKWTEEEIQAMGSTMTEKASYMSDLIEDLNLTYRLKNNALPIEKSVQDIVPLLKDVIHSLTNTDSTIRMEKVEPEIRLAVDPKWFTRILTNLLANAQKHNPKGTEITLSVSRNPEHTFLTIKDNGVGMDEETQSKLFDRYYRGGNTTDKSNGTGLGMAIAHQLVLAHGGNVFVESEKGKGTTIIITLPNGLENLTSS